MVQMKFFFVRRHLIFFGKSTGNKAFFILILFLIINNFSFKLFLKKVINRLDEQKTHVLTNN